MARLSRRDALLRLANRRGVFRAGEAHKAGIPWAYLGRLVGEGALLRIGRGLYAHPDFQPTEHGFLAEVARRAPSAVICLLSALRYHEITTQNPLEVWIMIGEKARRPAIQTPALRVVRASGKALEAGITVHRIDGARVSITGIAKTVCDCFRYRSKVGLDVAIEALRQTLAERLATIEELQAMAEVDRVTSVMRPYLESLA